MSCCPGLQFLVKNNAGEFADDEIVGHQNLTAKIN